MRCCCRCGCCCCPGCCVCRAGRRTTAKWCAAPLLYTPTWPQGYTNLSARVFPHSGRCSAYRPFPVTYSLCVKRVASLPLQNNV
eukprot:6209918-Prymnesium_polylepis.1